MARYPGVANAMAFTVEATEGTSQAGTSGVTTYAIPGRGDNFCTLAQKKLATVLPSNVGHGRIWKVVHPMDEVMGNINTWLFPTKGTAPLLDMALALQTGPPLDLYSYTIDKYTPNRNYQRFVGCKVESLEIAAAANSPDAQPVTLAYAIRGMSMSDPGSFSEGSYNDEDPYVFSRGTFTINGAADTTVRAFSLSIANSLAQGRCTGTTPSYHQFGGREVRIRLTIDFDDVSLIGEYEAGTHTDISLAFTHPLGAAYDLSLDLLTDVAYMTVAEGEPLNDVATLEVEALATMVGGGDITYSIS